MTVRSDGFYFQGQKKIQEWLERVKAKAGNHQDLYDELADILLAGTHDRFDRGIGPDDRPWKQSWRAKSQAGQTLRDTGRLRNSIRIKLSKNGFSLATNLVYAPIHQFGGVIRPKNKPYLTLKTPTGGWIKVKSVTIPARPFLGVSADDAQLLLLEIEDYLEKLLKNAG